MVRSGYFIKGHTFEVDGAELTYLELSKDRTFRVYAVVWPETGKLRVYGDDMGETIKMKANEEGAAEKERKFSWIKLSKCIEPFLLSRRVKVHNVEKPLNRWALFETLFKDFAADNDINDLFEVEEFLEAAKDDGHEIGGVQKLDVFMPERPSPANAGLGSPQNAKNDGVTKAPPDYESLKHDKKLFLKEVRGWAALSRRYVPDDEIFYVLKAKADKAIADFLRAGDFSDLDEAIDKLEEFLLPTATQQAVDAFWDFMGVDSIYKSPTPKEWILDFKKKLKTLGEFGVKFDTKSAGVIMLGLARLTDADSVPISAALAHPVSDADVETVLKRSLGGVSQSSSSLLFTRFPAGGNKTKKSCSYCKKDGHKEKFCYQKQRDEKKAAATKGSNNNKNKKGQ